MMRWMYEVEDVEVNGIKGGGHVQIDLYGSFDIQCMSLHFVPADKRRKEEVYPGVWAKKYLGEDRWYELVERAWMELKPKRENKTEKET